MIDALQNSDNECQASCWPKDYFAGHEGGPLPGQHASLWRVSSQIKGSPPRTAKSVPFGAIWQRSTTYFSYYECLS